MKPLSLSDLSVVFISYDEPHAEENFHALQKLVPTAQRVHGVKGFDAAHRFAGAVAKSENVVTIDGDNRIIQPDFFTRHFHIGAQERASVISFGARVFHNGLTYGNGGIKIWPRAFLRTLRTHEAARDGGASVDFAGQVPYFQVNEVPSETIVTTSPKTAFRSGYREGSRLTLAKRKLPHEVYPDLSPAEALRNHMAVANRDRLRIWCSVGRHAENGRWAMFGARLGCIHSNIDQLPMKRLTDYTWVDAFWRNEMRDGDIDDDGVDLLISDTEAKLEELELSINDLSAEESISEIEAYVPPRRMGALWAT